MRLLFGVLFIIFGVDLESLLDIIDFGLIKLIRQNGLFVFFLMLGGSAAVQGSCRWWCRNHRIHHRYTDTPKDPYNAKEGFLFSHFGWMFIKPDPSLIQKGDFDITDLEADPMVMFQNKHYGFFAIFMGFIFPTLVPGLLWGDWMGGYFFSAIARLVFVHHATFFVNSLAHWKGLQPYADRETPRDHFLTAFLTLGEGYHNFHHEFPQDFRNAIKFWQYDPTKWLIKFLNIFGLTYDLQSFGDNEIKMGQWQIKMKNAMKEKSDLDKEFNKEVESMTMEQVKKQISKHKKLIIINNAVVDITEFISEHPGGDFITKYIGKDATEDYNKLHYHTKAARLLMETKKVAILKN